MPDLIHNLEAVKQRIAMAAHVAGRDARSIALLAVSIPVICTTGWALARVIRALKK